MVDYKIRTFSGIIYKPKENPSHVIKPVKTFTIYVDRDLGLVILPIRIGNPS
jgi:predicted MPP superfamily phosphohydrolase